MSAIGGVNASTISHIPPAAPPSGPPKADNDGDEATESNTAKAAEAAGRGGVNVVA